MKSFFLLVILSFLSLSSFATSRDLGQLLPYKTDSSGEPSFGAVYSYGLDPDGTNYLFTYSPKVSVSEGAKSFRWNFYLNSSDSFVLNWSPNKKTQLALFQLSVNGETPEIKTAINKILAGQKLIAGKNDLFFVLADDNNVPIYNIPLSVLCGQHPQKFHDLTYEKRCDEITP